MISANNITLRIGKKALFEEVNIKFTEGNCYGLIGANGAGKSTFLKILTGKQDPTTGNVSLEPGKRMSVLEHDHFAYDNYTVLETVLRGNKKLFDIKEEMDALNVSTFSVSRGMANTMADIKGVDIWVNFTETDRGVLCELRSSRFNINPIAVKYGGGGHQKASGATLKDREEAMSLLADLIAQTEEK